MKILYVIPFFPFPARGGGYLRVSNLIKQLSKRHELHLVCLAITPQEALSESRELALPYAKSVEVIPHDHSRSRALWRQVTRRLPYEVALCFNPRMQEAVGEAIERLQPDAVLCCRLAGSQALPPDLPQLTILDQHDLARYLWSTFVEGNPHWWVRWYCHLNRALVKTYELRSYRKFKACISVSPAEREMTKAFAPPDLQLLVAPNGVDPAFYYPHSDVPLRPKSLVMTGTMNQQRNVEAAKVAATQILPQLRRDFAETELTIVGRTPSESVRRLANLPGVTVTGEVEDVRPYIASAEAILAPYWFGSGVKHKIPIAMGMGKAIVGTSNAFQGIDVVDGTHALIGETPNELVAKLSALFRDEALRLRLEQAALELAQRRYTWDLIVDQLDEALFAPHAASE